MQSYWPSPVALTGTYWVAGDPDAQEILKQLRAEAIKAGDAHPAELWYDFDSSKAEGRILGAIASLLRSGGDPVALQLWSEDRIARVVQDTLDARLRKAFA